LQCQAQNQINEPGLQGPLAARVEAVGVQEGSFSRLLELSAGDGERAEVREAALHYSLPARSCGGGDGGT